VNFTIRKNDLTLELTEAIVNPANSKLAHEGGAAKAIAQTAGKEFEEDCRTYISNYGQLRKLNVLKLMISE
jgi:O-acetyl-ADP-ribose deacetylase